ncbi:hypothetical protein FHS96_002349 [Sphingomonas zeicaulis]|uniref:hypothetical protein n=1 Tax=Sphingomonas zeicaulis TaxID=1632740 RepID=UPI003D2106BB
MTSKLLGLVAIASLALTGIALPESAQARERFRSVHAHGLNGRGYDRYRQVSRQPGSLQVQRGYQGSGGRGIQSSRGRSCANGTCSGGASHVTNNGTRWGRSGTITNNGDGTASYARSVTGPGGGSRSSSGTIGRAY